VGVALVLAADKLRAFIALLAGSVAAYSALVDLKVTKVAHVFGEERRVALFVVC
jgi:hypothetical protein